MDRLLAGTMLFAAIIQAQLLFVGAFQVSLQTNWSLLGNYVRQEVTMAYKAATQPSLEPAVVASKPTAKPNRATFIDSASEDEQAKAKP